jgi:hypothetical protein
MSRLPDGPSFAWTLVLKPNLSGMTTTMKEEFDEESNDI